MKPGDTHVVVAVLAHIIQVLHRAVQHELSSMVFDIDNTHIVFSTGTQAL